MHTHINRWPEKSTGYRYVGMVGYDDPVYEPYEKKVIKEESIIVFDFMEEKHQYHEMVLRLKPKAQRILHQRIVDIADQVEEKYGAALKKFNELCDEQMKRYNNTPWWRRLFVEKRPVESGIYVKSPNEETFKRQAIAEHTNSLHHTASIIVEHPNDYNRFIGKVYSKDYLAIIEF